MTQHNPNLYVSPALASVRPRAKQPTRELRLALELTPRLVHLAFDTASASQIAKPCGVSDETVYAWRAGRFQPQLAHVLAMPPRAARRILSASLHLVDLRVLPLRSFDSLLVVMQQEISALLVDDHSKPVCDCNKEELVERLARLHEIRDNADNGIREIERTLSQIDVTPVEKGGR